MHSCNLLSVYVGQPVLLYPASLRQYAAMQISTMSSTMLHFRQAVCQRAVVTHNRSSHFRAMLFLLDNALAMVARWHTKLADSGDLRTLAACCTCGRPVG